MEATTPDLPMYSTVKTDIEATEASTVGSYWMTSAIPSLQDHTASTNIVMKQMVMATVGPVMLSIVILGLMGNMLSAVVMSTKTFSKMAISRVIRCLALSDSLYLLCIINNQPWFHQLLGLDLRVLSPASCKIVNWMTRSTAIFSAWMVILLAAERFLAVWFFEMVKRVFSIRKMTACIMIVVFITAVFNAVWTAHSDAVIDGRCVANAKGDVLTKNFLAACVFLYVGIPAPLLLLLNLLIIIRLHMHSRSSKETASIPQHRVTAMLLAVTSVFILFVPPIALCHMLAQVLGQNLFTTDELPLFVAGQTAQLLFVLNCAVNFYLYVVMGGTFRNKLIVMLCARCRRGPATATAGSGKPQSSGEQDTPSTTATESSASKPEQHSGPAGEPDKY